MTGMGLVKHKLSVMIALKSDRRADGFRQDRSRMGSPRERVSQGGIEESRSDLRGPSGPHEKARLQRGNGSLSHKQAETGDVQRDMVLSRVGCNRRGDGQTGGYLIAVGRVGANWLSDCSLL